ncbi:MAG: ABC transporter ATP-binding protein, partial [Candidatus Omnitrophica bacterium]|nr:ABC transporter ATP-binding protein [Candidatus Omnitrophota bacterium]
MSDFALKVENAGKKFTKSLKRSMLYGAVDIMQSALGLTPNTSNLRDDEFWAVNDVSFEIKKGDCFGIIGPNGSGKTTLLKLLNGIFMPDKGKIEINGKIGALIQVGAGFHPLLSGRENIYINGAILGMTKKEIDKKFDEIVEFSEIEEFLDAPVKHYSSGMFVRLGFAIAVHCEPDILLIDEILAVGDRDFSLKCYQKINEIRKSGVSIILVSHNEYIIREQTSKCLYINKGYKRFEGPSDEGITLYIKESLEGSRRKMHIEEQESLQSTNRKCA